jgi:hypothetical protein
MAPNRLRAATASDPHLIAPALAAWLSVFRSCFTAPVWNRVLSCSPFQAAGTEIPCLSFKLFQHGRRWARQEARS